MGAITRFAASHPDVRIEVESRLSRNLRGDLAADRLDMVVAIAPTQDEAYLVNTAAITPIWAVGRRRLLQAAASVALTAPMINRTWAQEATQINMLA